MTEKHLTVTYGGVVIYDGPVGRFSWNEAPTGIDIKASPPGVETPNLLQQIGEAVKARQQQNGTPPAGVTTP